MRIVSAAKRMREHRMMLEIGSEEVSNALTQNIDHSLIGLIYDKQDTDMRHSLMFRYPHGYFPGGLIKTNVSPTITISGYEANNFIVNIKQDKDMKQRDFHRHCRVIYRACRKLYGIEKVQDECLRVFKVIYPLYYKAQKSGEFGFDDKARERMRKIFDSWQAKSGSVLEELIITIWDRMVNEEFCRASFVEFCDDILVVVMRIRKLTEREVFRLQDVDDKYIDLIKASGISKSACYRLAGNSITVNVLYHLFRKLFIEPEPDMVKGEAYQLNLF